MGQRIIRTSLNITEVEHNFLQKKSEEKCLSMSELIRRILDEYIERENDNKSSI